MVHTKGKERAVVIVAHRLVVDIWHILKRQHSTPISESITLTVGVGTL